MPVSSIGKYDGWLIETGLIGRAGGGTVSERERERDGEAGGKSLYDNEPEFPSYS